VGGQPLPSVLWPDAHKVPLFAIPFCLSCQIKTLYASGNLLSN
jgi:hypothetical protein